MPPEAEAEEVRAPEVLEGKLVYPVLLDGLRFIGATGQVRAG